MIKLFIIGRRCPGKTREASHTHLRAVHGPLVYDPPADAGLLPAKYVQNHVFSPTEGLTYKDRDLVTEIWFNSVSDLGASTKTPFYKTMLEPDEPNFVDTTSVLKGAVREGELVGKMPPNAIKLFVVLKKHADADMARYEAACDHAIETALADGHFDGFVHNGLLPPPGGGDPFADHILEFWFATAAPAGEFVIGPLATMKTAMQGLLDETRSYHLLAEEYTVDRLRAAGKQAA